MNPPRQPPVLLLDANRERRRRYAAALRANGFEVSAVDHIAEIERWPVGTIVIVDAARFTPWWGAVGAAHVVVLSDSLVAARQSCNGVPSTWILRRSGPEAVISVLQAL